MRLVHCAECGRNKPHYCKGLCKSCYARQQNAANPEPARARARRWNKANPEKKREAERRRYAANVDKERERSRRYREANPEKRSETCRNWTIANPGQSGRWRRANPEQAQSDGREYARRRRARKNGVTVEPVDEAAIYERDGHMCIYCGATENLELDHIVPLASGGAHCEDNLVVACLSCNRGKYTKPLEDWLQTQPKALAWVM